MSPQTLAKSEQLKLFLALSRTPHLLIDLATPMAVALLCLGKFPPLATILIGMITVFAGYACIYALNDVTDHRLDRKRLGQLPEEPVCFDLDCTSVRHPLAQGLISLVGGVAWTVFWGIVALVGAALLHPVCAVIFVIGAILEVVYCKLYQLTEWKILIAAVVKNLGGLAAIFAVNSQPSPTFVVLIFIWIALWEAGGQNIPNDLVDVREDRSLGARTIPVVYGPGIAVVTMIVALIAGSVLGLGVVFVSPLEQKGVYVLGGVLSGVLFLLLPLKRFLSQNDTSKAINLFNQASLYPVGILSTTILCILLQYV
ncbi:MAG: UbiA family prenyltransferase [Deltaproteobacteria bacterium]|nr:MAG: UbiA family prenyltransferase [Deltaproteobacteria bacterium]